MSKRFFDTGTWAKLWFRELTPADKVAWFYILTHCDAVGVWDADTKMADFCIGDAVDWEHLKEASNGNIEVLENGKWWMVDFCKFQYGSIGRVNNSKVQKHLCSLLDEHGLWDSYLSTVGPTVDSTVGTTVQDKEKDKDKEKEKEKDYSSKRPERIFYNFDESVWYGISDEQVKLWSEAYPAVDIDLELRQMGEWCKSNGARGHKQDWRKFIVNWLKRSQDRGGSEQKGGGTWKNKRYSR